MEPSDVVRAAAKQIRMLSGRGNYAESMARAAALDQAARAVMTEREAGIALLAAGLTPGDYIWRELLQQVADPRSPEVPHEIRVVVEGGQADNLLNLMAGAVVFRRQGETDSELRMRIKNDEEG